MPSSILELVHDRRAGAAIDPAYRSPAPQVRGEQVAPGAAARPPRMATAVASRGGQLDDPVPAARACQAAIGAVVEAPADDACAREEQVERGLRPGAPRDDRRDHDCIALESACRITSRGAAMPNHHSKA